MQSRGGILPAGAASGGTGHQDFAHIQAPHQPHGHQPQLQRRGKSAFAEIGLHPLPM